MNRLGGNSDWSVDETVFVEGDWFIVASSPVVDLFLVVYLVESNGTIEDDGAK